MRNTLRIAAPWAAALAVLFIPRPACARTPRPAAIIIAPKRDARVSSETELFGKLLLPGRPVVLVREDRPTSPWYVQGTGQPIDGKTFKTRVKFGSDETPQGQRFFVMVVLMRNAKELEIFQPRTAIDEIPWNMPRSAQIPVVLESREKPRPQANLLDRPIPEGSVSPIVSDRWEEPEPQTNLTVEPTPEPEVSSVVSDQCEKPQTQTNLIVEPTPEVSPVAPNQRDKPQPQTNSIIRPTPGSKVSQMEDLVAHVDDGALVVAMVRSDEPGSYWWVQDVVKNTQGGKVTATVRFGNQNTKSDTRFGIVLLLPTSAKEIEQFRVGDYMRHLPEHIQKSKEVHVILQ
jgi:hypothetical protein